ncbi:MAG: pyridoxal phosphate-dependent aminotransferase, partial [Candidatus Hodgkinia cicadicola]
MKPLNCPQISSAISAIACYALGGTPRLQSKTFKLSSNENPLGAGVFAIKGLKAVRRALERRPAEALAALKLEVANAYALKVDNLTFGNGSDEFLSLLCKLFLVPGDEAIMGEHSFPLYRTQVLAAGVIPVIVGEVGGRINIIDMLTAVTYRTKLVFVTVPANPTGTLLTARELMVLRKALPASVILLLDLTYAEYVKDDRLVTNRVLFESNVISIRTFSKIYGLAALRIGWAHSPKSYADAISKVKSPFNINWAAQVIGASVANDLSHRRTSLSFSLFWITKLA